MTIDPDAVGARTEPVEHTWTSTDSLLYAVGIGAGTEALAFTTENTADVPQRAYPTQAVVVAPADPAVLGMFGEYERRMIVHGTQRVELHAPLAPEGTVVTTAEVRGIHDKGKAAVVEVATEAVDPASGEPVCTCTMELVIRGAGGFGRSVGPVRDRPAAPEGEPPVVLPAPTRPDQALRYRLTGDRNPLHSDPSVATAVGFERPILHGLCTFGIAGRVLLHGLLDGDPDRVRALEGRFSAPVLPGDDLVVRAWPTEGGAAFDVLGPGGTPVMTDGRLTER